MIYSKFGKGIELEGLKSVTPAGQIDMGWPPRYGFMLTYETGQHLSVGNFDDEDQAKECRKDLVDFWIMKKDKVNQ